MWPEKPVCSRCGQEIRAEEMIYVKMRYPKRQGFTEIKAYLHNEGKFICEDCASVKPLSSNS